MPDVRSALSVDSGAAGFECPAELGRELAAALESDLVISGLSGPDNESLLADLDRSLLRVGQRRWSHRC